MQHSVKVIVQMLIGYMVQEGNVIANKVIIKMELMLLYVEVFYYILFFYILLIFIIINIECLNKCLACSNSTSCLSCKGDRTTSDCVCSVGKYDDGTSENC